MIGAVDLMAVVVAGVLMLFACCAYHLSFCMHCPSLAPKSQCTQGLTSPCGACGAVVGSGAGAGCIFDMSMKKLNNFGLAYG